MSTPAPPDWQPMQPTSSTQPESVEAGEEMVTYIFSAEEGASLVDVTFTFKPERLGMHRAGIQTGEGELSIRQFAFP